MATGANYVFYSWQSDLPAAHNRSFIESAIEDAMRQINAEAAVEPSPRGDLALDKDTKGVAGSPAITDTIVKKIKGCSVFVGDLSFVAQSLPEIVSPKKPVRFVPNPNVVIEHTHATDFHGEERVIAVVNEAYGGKLGENLPFNLRHRRWPIRYTCGPDTTPEEKKAVRKQLVADLVTAIRLVLDTRQPPAPTTAPFIGSNFLPTEFARQAKSGDLIVDGPQGDDMAPYAIPERCIISLRLQPTVRVPEFESEGDAYQAVVRGRLRPMAGYEISGQSPARNAMGGIVFVAPRNGNLLYLSQLFMAKELYGIDAGAAGVWRDTGSQRPMFHIERVEESYAVTLRNYLRFARRTLDLPAPWKISAAVYGVQNFLLAGRRCLKPEIHWSKTITPDTPVLEALNPFFLTLWKSFSVDRPADASQALANLLSQMSESD